MKKFYIFDGEDFVECSEELRSDLIELCEDNEVMIEAIKNYFKSMSDCLKEIKRD
jgi:hypothetical protein